MPDANPTPLVVSSAPLTIDAAPRNVAAAIDAFLLEQGGTVTWNKTRTSGTITESTPAATVTLTFALRSAGSGKTNLGVQVSFDSELLNVVPREMIEAQLEQSCNQVASVISHLATRGLGANPPDQGLSGAA